MAQRMGSNRLADARNLAGFLASPAYRERADVLAGDVTGEEPVARFVHSPPSAQDLKQSWRQHYVTIFFAFALVDTNDHPLAIDVGGLQKIGRASCRERV